MSFTLFLPFSEALAFLRRQLLVQGLEIAVEWDASLDLRDSMGTQVADIRCIYVFDPVELLHCVGASAPASALTAITLRDLGSYTEISVCGRGLACRKALAALPRIRHAA